MSRRKQILNFDWRFHLGDVEGAQLTRLDDSDWESVDLPHDYSIHGDFDRNAGPQNGYRPRGIGWYRKRFVTTPDLIDAVVHLEFEGVYMAPDIWLNGVHLGKRYNGYLDFQFNITDALKPEGEENVLAVRVDNWRSGTSRWYTGSGIYRHVWLVRTNTLYVPRYGTYVTTPSITADQASVHVETKIRNAGDATRLTTLVTTVSDPAGATVAEATYVAPVEAGTTHAARQELTVETPQRWSTDSPKLYTVHTSVRDEQGEQDTYQTRFGIRTIEIAPDQGLLLNGEKVFCKGFNIHHDNGCLGSAAFDRAIQRRLEVMKELGCNAVRLSHNPHAVKVLESCDEMGILVFDEAYDKWDGQFNGNIVPFEDTWRDDVRDWLERDRNHPSVFIWSAGNEIVKHQMNEANEWGVPQLKRMVDFIHTHEPTRKVTAGLFPARAKGVRNRQEGYAEGEPAEMAFHMEVMSVNYMERFFEQDHKKYPQLSFILSEATTGMGAQPWEKGKERESGITGGTLPFFAFDHSHTVGIFYWGGIEYIGEARQWPWKGWHRGFIDLAGWPKPSGQLCRATFSDEPMVYAAITNLSEDEQVVWNDVTLISAEVASHWNWQPGNTIEVTTFSNCDSVELLLNGRSLGRREVTKQDYMALTWQVPYEPGTLVAIARNGDTEVDRYTLETAGEPSRLDIQSDRDTLTADGLDLAHLTIHITDDQGRCVPTASHKLHFTVDGAGTNAGVDNGDLQSDERWQADSRSAFKGRALLIVRAARAPGNVTITATADGIAPASVTLPVA